MIGKQNKNANFFDSYVFDNLLPKKHILLDIKKEIDFSFVEEELRDLPTLSADPDPTIIKPKV